MSPLTGLVGRLAALPHAAAAGVIFLDKIFSGRKVKSIKRPEHSTK